jgi:hypothetical protein
MDINGVGRTNSVWIGSSEFNICGFSIQLFLELVEWYHHVLIAC